MAIAAPFLAPLASAFSTALPTGLAGAVTSAGIGAGESLLTGGDPGKGALGGLAGNIGGNIGGDIGGPAGQAIGSGLGGALANGSNPLQGAITGAVGNYGSKWLLGDNSSGGGWSGNISGGSTPGGGIEGSLSGQGTPGTAGAASQAGGGGAEGGGPIAGGAPSTHAPQGGNLGNAGGALDKEFAANPSLYGGAPQTLGQQVAKALGLNPSQGVGLFVANHPGQLAQAGIFGLQAMRQKAAQEAMLAPLTQAAQEANQRGAALSAAALGQGGQLPSGLQAGVDLAQRQAEADVRSQFAAAGLSGSSMEAAALARVREETAANKANIANNLLQSGLQQSGLSASLYGSIVQNRMASDTALQEALARLAGNLAGGAYSAGK